jgi:flagellar motor switch protein FliN/FliY
MTAPDADVMHPLYRDAIAPLASGVRDVLGAMLTAGGLELGEARPQIVSLGQYAAQQPSGAVAYPFALTGALAIEGVLLISGEALRHLVGALLGDGSPPDSLDEFHIPMLRDTIGNLLGRWAASLSEARGMSRLNVSLESSMSPLAAQEVLTAGPLAHASQVAVEELPFLFAGSAGTLSLLLPASAILLLVSSHPAYTPPESAPMDNTPFGTSPNPPQATSMEQVSVSRPQFQQLSERQMPQGEPRRLDLLRDVPLTITVELGQKSLTIKDILELSPGALIELNRLAGEPLDLLINGQLFAKGEVVVIDESFGMRITSIVSPEERLQGLR